MIEKDVTVKKISVIFHVGCTMFSDFIGLFLFLADLSFLFSLAGANSKIIRTSLTTGRLDFVEKCPGILGAC